MTWDTFLAHPLPPDMSPLAVWDMLGSIGQCIGVHLFDDEDGNLLWYRRTHELSDLVDAIERLSAKESSFCEVLLDHADRSFTLGLRLAEYVAALRLSRHSVDCDHLEMHVRLGTLPDHPAERAVANAVLVDQDLPLFVREPFSRSLLGSFYERLTEGLAPDDIESLSIASAGAIDEQTWNIVQHQLDAIMEYANASGDDEDLLVMQGNLVADAIRYHEPFGFASSLVASLASRLFFLKHDLPVLALVPVSHAKLRWLDRKLGDRTLCSPAEYESTLRRTCCDLTVHHTLSAQCMKVALDEAEARITGVADKDSAAKSMLSSDARFNHRQRSILARALRTPLAEFHIRYHQEKHRISYATARRDLVELSEAGYLRAEQRGKAFVFIADEGVEELSRNL